METRRHLQISLRGMGAVKTQKRNKNQRFKQCWRRRLYLQALMIRTIRKGNSMVSTTVIFVSLVLLELGKFFEVCIIKPVFLPMRFRYTKTQRQSTGLKLVENLIYERDRCILCYTLCSISTMNSDIGCMLKYLLRVF